MTYFYYKTYTWPDGSVTNQNTNQAKLPQETLDLWTSYSKKKNWRITELPNGYFQTEFNLDDIWKSVTRRETIEAAERAIDSSIEHYKRKLKLYEGPTVVKTFEDE